MRLIKEVDDIKGVRLVLHGHSLDDTIWASSFDRAITPAIIDSCQSYLSSLEQDIVRAKAELTSLDV